MKKKLSFILLVICTMFLFAHCTYKSKALIEPKFGTYNFTTFTVDTLRLRVMLNDLVLTDSLLSPQGSFSKTVSFIDAAGSLLITNTKNNQVILDSVMMLKTGTTTISLVQFVPGQTPFLPPSPNEPLPAPGNYKIRFQYLKPNNPDDPAMSFYDSVKCFINKNGSPFDTIVLKKFGLSGFYESASGTSFNIQRLESPSGTKLNSSPTNYMDFTDGFNTVAVFGSSGNAIPNYGFTLKFIY